MIMPSISLKGLKICTGLKLCTIPDRYLQHKWYLWTNDKYLKEGVCEYCGKPYLKNNSNTKLHYHYCSTTCSNRASRQAYKKNRLQLALHILSPKEITGFKKKMDNFVYSKIFECKSEYHEDLIDWWNENYILIAQKLYKRGMSTCMKYLQKSIYYAHLNLIKTKKEVFYDECSLKVQESILGCYNDWRQ